MSIYSLVEAGVLFLNGLAILNEERFLDRGTCFLTPCAPPLLNVFAVGLGGKQDVDQYGQPRSGIKQQVAQLLTAMRLLLRRTHVTVFMIGLTGCVLVPLIGVNVLVIVLLLLFG